MVCKNCVLYDIKRMTTQTVNLIRILRSLRRIAVLRHAANKTVDVTFF